ncbi:MAG: DNA cytosine methyltransferase [Lysobacteraceae bacterium]
MADFYEFFAGGGMARAGLGRDWQCVFANDFDPKKAASYAANWGADHLHVGDVAALTTADLPGAVDLAWASFPCQDLSLAGVGAGIRGARSGAFWPFWELIRALDDEGRAPRLVVLENVCGTLSSHDGKDFAAISSALSANHYRFGAVVINAVHFLPQSRPRLFIIGVRKSSPIPHALVGGGPEREWHPAALVEAFSKLPAQVRGDWEWWRLPMPAPRTRTLADLIEDEAPGVAWHDAAETEKLLAMMNSTNRSKVSVAMRVGGRQVGTIYKRTRADGPNREKVQRAEIRFDDIAGCLRTPAGGSSRQTIMVVEGKRVRSRLLSAREAARLMGLPDTYALPENYNDAYHLAGDGVAVPVVRFLAEHILEPLLAAARSVEKKAA